MLLQEFIDSILGRTELDCCVCNTPTPRFTKVCNHRLCAHCLAGIEQHTEGDIRCPMCRSVLKCRSVSNSQQPQQYNTYQNYQPITTRYYNAYQNYQPITRLRTYALRFPYLG